MSSSSDPFSHLNATHRQQLQTYIKYFQQRTQQVQSEVEAQIEDVSESHISDGEIYRSDDMHALCKSVARCVSDATSSELQKWLSQTSIYLRQLLLQAEGHAISLRIDTDSLEDEELIELMQKFGASSNKENLLAPASPNGNKLAALPQKPTKLASLTQSSTVDVNLVTRIKDLEASNRTVLQRAEAAESKAAELAIANQQLDQRVQTLTAQSTALQQDVEHLQTSNTSAQQLEIDKLRLELTTQRQATLDTLKQKEAEVQQAKAELQDKINKSQTVMNLKKMIQTKNEQMKELRTQLRDAGAPSKAG